MPFSTHVFSIPLAALLMLGTASAMGMELSLPVACAINDNCFIQNFVDRNEGPGFQDYQCGALSSDDHKGTDFRLAGWPEMRMGIAVLAAAPGRIKGIRDGMEDGYPDTMDKRKLRRREAGNGVVIDHGDGWETQYNHLRKDSVTVFPGQKVPRGHLLGQIGQSGLAEFPHLEFVVRHHGRVVDPFTGETDVNGCGATRAPLWDANALRLLVYMPTGELSSGFATDIPTRETYTTPPTLPVSLLPEAPALVFWVNILGAREGDMEKIRLIDPNGKTLASNEGEIDDHRSPHQRFVGRKRSGTAPWPEGTYTGEYTLTRLGGDEPLLTITKSIKIPEW